MPLKKCMYENCKKYFHIVVRDEWTEIDLIWTSINALEVCFRSKVVLFLLTETENVEK